MEDFTYICVILALKAKRLLHKGCEAYLAHMIDKFLLEITLDSVLMMREFLDAFFEPSLSIDRGLKFRIKLLLGLAPIFIPPYRMTPAELKELKIQLQDFVDKGFIRPNVSLWDAPVLL